MALSRSEGRLWKRLGNTLNSSIQTHNGVLTCLPVLVAGVGFPRLLAWVLGEGDASACSWEAAKEPGRVELNEVSDYRGHTH